MEQEGDKKEAGKKEGGKKEGVSVREIESFTKKHYFEIFFGIAFILAAFFTFMYFGPAWSISFATAGGVIGIWIPNQIGLGFQKIFQFLYKQEKITQIIVGVIVWILSIFLPFLTFLLLGLMGGVGCHVKSSKEFF